MRITAAASHPPRLPIQHLSFPRALAAAARNRAENRLTVDVAGTRVDLARAASEIEREWLYRVLAERYALPQSAEADLTVGHLQIGNHRSASRFVCRVRLPPGRGADAMTRATTTREQDDEHQCDERIFRAALGEPVPLLERGITAARRHSTSAIDSASFGRART
jgi:hypothetical protein